MEFLVYSVFIGVGATAFMDVWALLMNRLFDIPSLNYAMVGRWLGHVFGGRFFHNQIAQSSPVAGEMALGWGAHYLIGVVFAAAFLFVWGIEWAANPDIVSALLFGVLTVAAPFFIMQPGMGAGVAGANTPAPNITRMRSLMAHVSFGVGLYFAGEILNQLI